MHDGRIYQQGIRRIKIIAVSAMARKIKSVKIQKKKI
jgi:hypothetical protein